MDTLRPEINEPKEKFKELRETLLYENPTTIELNEDGARIVKFDNGEEIPFSLCLGAGTGSEGSLVREILKIRDGLERKIEDLDEQIHEAEQKKLIDKLDEQDRFNLGNYPLTTGR